MCHGFLYFGHLLMPSPLLEFISHFSTFEVICDCLPKYSNTDIDVSLLSSGGRVFLGSHT